MRPRKKCPYCHRLFDPYPGQYHIQKACLKPECQKQRRRQTNRDYREKNRYDADYRRPLKKAWRQAHGRLYMRRYRKKHVDYVKRNRRLQLKRNERRRRKIVKKDVWNTLWCGKLMRIRILESDCKERLMRLLPEEKPAPRV